MIMDAVMWLDLLKCDHSTQQIAGFFPLWLDERAWRSTTCRRVWKSSSFKFCRNLQPWCLLHKSETDCLCHDWPWIWGCLTHAELFIYYPQLMEDVTGDPLIDFMLCYVPYCSSIQHRQKKPNCFNWFGFSPVKHNCVQTHPNK